ncbi:MAG: DUF4422 domain-containing protein [Lachnospiraceae bacterium]|nr:DUF4422 domain-containing protein [Lachnospiraceae bacterium]
MMNVTIFCMTHKIFEPPKDPIYQPLHVGRALSKDLGFKGDHTGENISDQNPYYAELTGVYWAWKNSPADIIGICHYRRFLLNDENRLLTGRECERLLQQYDILLPKCLTLRKSYYEGFGANHNRKDLDVLEQVVREMEPDYWQTFHNLVHENHTYFGNMMICRREVFQAYCSFLFPLLKETEKRIDPSKYDGYGRRVYGFLSEFLLTVWVKVKRLHVKECMVGMIGEKAETRQLCLMLSERFAARDINGARRLCQEHIAKRPDLLMEASDINGDLKLAMQIITTCEHELEAYGMSQLLENDYENAKKHCRALNRLVDEYRLAALQENGEPALEHAACMMAPKREDISFTEEKREFWKAYHPTEIGLTVSVRMFCQSENAELVLEQMKGDQYDFQMQ